MCLSKKIIPLFIFFFLAIINIFPFGIAFSFSSYSLEIYKTRLNEIQNDPILGIRNNNYLWGSYAGSSHSLDVFKSRLEEIQKDPDGSGDSRKRTSGRKIKGLDMEKGIEHFAGDEES